MESAAIKNLILDVEKRRNIRLDPVSAAFLLELNYIISSNKPYLEVDRNRSGRQAFFYGFGKLGLGLIIASISFVIVFLKKEDNYRMAKAIEYNTNYFKRFYDSVTNTKIKVINNANGNKQTVLKKSSAK